MGPGRGEGPKGDTKSFLGIVPLNPHHRPSLNLSTPFPRGENQGSGEPKTPCRSVGIWSLCLATLEGARRVLSEHKGNARHKAVLFDRWTRLGNFPCRPMCPGCSLPPAVTP